MGVTETVHADDVEVEAVAVGLLAFSAHVLPVVFFALAPGVESEVLLTHVVVVLSIRLFF